MDMSAWQQEITQFKDLLRLPVESSEEGVRLECKEQIEKLSEEIAYLIFESYTDWYDQDDGWLLTNLSQWLTPDQDGELLRLLGSSDGKGVIGYLSDTCLDEWKAEASAQQFQPVGDEGISAEPHLVGYENTVNWTASRTPGTFYYAYDGEEYLYSDDIQAPPGEWKPLPEREKAAADRALPWGDGWCTSTGGDTRYGGEYVFSEDREGPWLLREQVEPLLLAKAASQPVTVPQVDATGADEFEDDDVEEFDDEDVDEIMTKLLEEDPGYRDIPEERRREIIAEALAKVQAAAF